MKMSKSTSMHVMRRSTEQVHQATLSSVIVLVGGLPGAGKTYFASRLSDRLGAAYINSDLTRRQMVAQGRYAFEDKLIVYEKMAQQTAKELRRGKGVIVDATFYCRHMREIFFTLATLMHLKVIFIEIVADEKVVRERLQDLKVPGRSDLSVHNLVKTQYEQVDADHLVIESKDDSIDDMLEKAIAYISSFL